MCVYLCMCARLQTCRFCDRANAARGSPVSVERVRACVSGGLSGRRTGSA